ncbi:DUF4097 family beta strand repeat-containing protein [Aquimarina sediminis]|uniref:DUF4097 family beta strand repeat-containing protein n=1 Tax=Aquimarina sediminis TaxID=2070536 RepID=UPI000CA05B65|nr:DUF4097 family beta strand repeat-containing protein [Aquimarina sediminis]
MKKIAIALIVFIASGNLIAQDYTHSLQGIKKVKIHSSPGVTVKAYDKNELLIKGEEGLEKPDKAKGLKAVYSGGTDNTGIGIHIEKEGSVLVVKNLRNMHGPGIQIYLPKNTNVSVENHGISSLQISGFSSEIEAKTNVGGIEIKDVTGPIVAKSAAGGITVIFDKVNQSSPISIVSSAGDVDVSLPSSTPANLNLKAVMGEIYTDFDLKIPAEDNDMKIVGGRKSIETKINNGGVDITLRSAVGSIYLRKK